MVGASCIIKKTITITETETKIMSEVEKKGCEPADKCLFCIPILNGMRAFSVLTLISIISNIAFAITLTCYDSDAGLIYFFIIIPMLVAAVFLLRFLFMDAEKGRAHLPTTIVLLSF